MTLADLVAQFQAGFGLPDTNAVATVLDIEPSTFALYLTGTRPMPLPEKLRLLHHAGFSRETEKFAAVLVDIEAHRAAMEQDLQRLGQVLKLQLATSPVPPKSPASRAKRHIRPRIVVAAS